MVAKNKEDVCIGKVIGAYGVQGAVRMRVYSDEAGHILKFKHFKDMTDNVFTLKTLRVLKGDTVILKFKEVTSRNQAEELKGQELYITRAQLSALEEDEFYYIDLIGLEARTSKGDIIGKVIAVENHGAGDFLTISSKPLTCVPFTKEAVPEVYIQEGYLVIDEGFLQGQNDDES